MLYQPEVEAADEAPNFYLVYLFQATASLEDEDRASKLDVEGQQMQQKSRGQLKISQYIVH